MRIGSEQSWLPTTPRSGETRLPAERTTAHPDERRQAAADAQALATRTQRVTNASQTRSQAELSAQRAAEENDARRFAREAPTGERPRYIPKGQKLNILV